MNENINVRCASEADIGAIAELWKEFMDFHKGRDPHFSRSVRGHEAFAAFIADHIDNDTSRVLVATEGEDILGYCLATVAKYPPVFEKMEYGSISDLAVTEKHRRRGIGERMVKAVENWFLERNIRRVELRVATSNEISAAFWSKMGFVPYVETRYKVI
jgi:ribosomal protein S18 acetylase RimI-like enzyme